MIWLTDPPLRPLEMSVHCVPVPIVLAALDQAGLLVATVTVARPSLDDVYLRHAGRRFAQTDMPVVAAAGGSR